MYFAVLGRHPKLSLAEFALISTNTLRRQGSFLFFESDLDESILWSQLGTLGGIVKWGKVIHKTAQQTEPSILEGVGLIGVNDQKLGMELKKTYGVKRFKVVEVTASDLEVKQQGKEIIDLGQQQRGVVHGRQDIAHFEYIDFSKPAHGMEIGMMPAKLAQMLVNIGVSLTVHKGRKQTIYDPFCGFGTTGLVANRLGHHFIGSDIVIDGAKKNAKWVTQEGKELQQGDVLFTVFKHDATMSFDHPVLNHITTIVTEGWLGPVVTKKTKDGELQTHAHKIISLYTQFLDQITKNSSLPIVIVVPQYIRSPELIFPEINAHARVLGYQVTELAVYSRPRQEVARQILVLQK